MLAILGGGASCGRWWTGVGCAVSRFVVHGLDGLLGPVCHSNMLL